MAKVVTKDRCRWSPDGSHTWDLVQSFGQPSQYCVHCHQIRAMPLHEPSWLLLPAAPHSTHQVMICEVCGMTVHPRRETPAQHDGIHFDA